MTGRFVKLDVDTLQRRDLTAADKLVYACIRDRIGDNPTAWPGLRRIAADCGLSRTTAAAAVDRLATAGLLIVERPAGNPAGQSNFYRLPDDGDQYNRGGGGDTPRVGRKRDVPETGTSGGPEIGTSGRPKNGTSHNRNVPENGTPTSQKVVRGRTSIRTEPDSTRLNQNSSTAAAAALLREVGVKASVAAELAALHSRETIEHALACAAAKAEAGTLNKAGRAGYVVCRLREGDWEDPPELAQRQQRQHEALIHRTTEQVAEQQRRREDADHREALGAARRRLEAMPPEDQESVLDEARRRMPHRPAAVPEDWFNKPTWVLMADAALRERKRVTEAGPVLIRVAKG